MGWPHLAKQNRVFHTMCRHAGFRLGVGSRAVGTHSRLGRTPQQWVVRVAPSVVCFVLCIPLICIVVVPVPFVCCSVKLPLSRPTSFCLFLSILLLTPAGRGGVAAWCFCCQPQPNHNTFTSFSFHLHAPQLLEEEFPLSISSFFCSLKYLYFFLTCFLEHLLLCFSFLSSQYLTPLT